jgi:chromate reductase
MLLVNAAAMAPANVEVRIFDLNDIPLYDADVDNDESRPGSVVELKRALEASDGLLMATPEYNHGVPGVLKNAIDWASRPAGRSPLRSLPVAIIGASTGNAGTARAQQELKLTMLSTSSLLLPHPGVLVTNAGGKFRADGEIEDEQTRRQLALLMAELGRLIPAFQLIGVRTGR